MPKFQQTTVVPHSADQMFDLVADVQSYPEFLPMCERIVVLERRDKDGKTLLISEMTVGYKMIHESFTTRALLKPQENVIEVSYLDGPFRYLENRWTFVAKEDGGTDIHFYIDYEFRNRALGMLMGSMFDRAFQRFSQAFKERAREIYGPGGEKGTGAGQVSQAS